MKLEQLQTLVIEWAENKGLLTGVTTERVEKQTLKVLEEIGETAGAYLKGNREELIDGIGDVAVTLIILASMNGRLLQLTRMIDEDYANLMGITDCLCEFKRSNYDLSELDYAFGLLKEFTNKRGLLLSDCLESAYNVIAKRTGKMVNGTFIKD